MSGFLPGRAVRVSARSPPAARRGSSAARVPMAAPSGAGLAVIGTGAGRLRLSLTHVLPLFGLAIPSVVVAVIDVGAGVDPPLSRATPGSRLCGRHGLGGRSPS